MVLRRSSESSRQRGAAATALLPWSARPRHDLKRDEARHIPMSTSRKRLQRKSAPFWAFMAAKRGQDSKAPVCSLRAQPWQ